MILLSAIVLLIAGIKYTDNILFSHLEVWLTFAIYCANAIGSEIVLTYLVQPLVKWKEEHPLFYENEEANIF